MAKGQKLNQILRGDATILSYRCQKWWSECLNGSYAHVIRAVVTREWPIALGVGVVIWPLMEKLEPMEIQ